MEQAKAIKHLPASLAIREPKTRKALLQATAQPGIRIVFDLLDRKQLFPHAGVILREREIIGWVFGQITENRDYNNGDDKTDVLEWIDYSLVFREGRVGNVVLHSVDMPTTIQVHLRETVHKTERGVFSRWRYRHSSLDWLISEDVPLSIHRVQAMMFGEYLSTIREFRNTASLEITDRV